MHVSLPPLTRSLSARLLVLTIAFVMLGEVLIYVPSIARFRLVYLEERIAAARLAALAVEARDRPVEPAFGRRLLEHARVSAIALERPGRKALMLSDDMPRRVDASFDLRKATHLGLIRDGFATLWHGEGRVIRVLGRSPMDQDVVVEIVMPELPMRAQMLGYSRRILELSVVLALMTAGLVFLSLYLLTVRPMRRITESLVAFSRAPEDPATIIVPERRRDEFGVAQETLAAMQRRLRAALHHKTRLAALGVAVGKISHDLRNILSTAALVADRLAAREDPEVKRLTSTLMSTIDRAITLCTATLNFARADPLAPRAARFALRALVDEVGAALADEAAVTWRNEVPEELEVTADREQLYRALLNLVRNAAEAIGRAHLPEGEVGVRARREGGATLIEVFDTGPGLPRRAQAHLFEAFAGSAQVGGTGLGLPIARDILRAHGGELMLEKTGGDGTLFRLRLPDRAPGASRALAWDRHPPGGEAGTRG